MSMTITDSLVFWFQIFCIIVFALIASSPGYEYARSGTSRRSCLGFAIAVGVIFFLTTLILFILFLLTVVDRCCGKRAWNLIVSTTWRIRAALRSWLFISRSMVLVEKMFCRIWNMVHILKSSPHHAGLENRCFVASFKNCTRCLSRIRKSRIIAYFEENCWKIFDS